MVVVPETVAPPEGEVIDAVGRVVSEGGAEEPNLYVPRSHEPEEGLVAPAMSVVNAE